MIERRQSSVSKQHCTDALAALDTLAAPDGTSNCTHHTWTLTALTSITSLHALTALTALTAVLTVLNMLTVRIVQGTLCRACAHSSTGCWIHDIL